MKCPSCDRELPRASESCPACSTSFLESQGLAIHLAEDSERTLKGRPGAVAERGGGEDGRRFLPGTLWAGRYRISVALGRGGMGEVYRAEDLKLRSEVALKFLPVALEGEATKMARLAEEVRLARRITHPNVCRIYDLGEADGRRFISMEHIDGEDLGSLVRRVGRLSQPKALEIARGLALGLQAAHEEGVLHLDVKPSNLMLDGRGRARITDFGLAVIAEGAGNGGFLRAGTPAYMAPEQLGDGEVSVKSDLYSLGLVLYELFTGHKAFAERSLRELLAPSRPAVPTPPSHLVEGLDPAVERAVLDCLAPTPAERPASARALLALLPGEDRGALAFRPARGQTLPRRPHWRLEEKLGEGGFGEAWLATHSKTGEQRVFKFCHAVRHLQALKREITLFRLLKEELGERRDITRILDWSFDEPPYFIESEYTRGGNLQSWAEEAGGVARVPLRARLEIVAQAAEALAAAHSVGVLHKDVKPSNVLIHTGRDGEVQVRLNDFGIGLLIGDASLSEVGITPVSLTWTSGPSGTPLYRAPELLEGKPPTVQADIYALGVMLYQLVAGDLNRALGPGWERDVDDEMIREDIALAVDKDPRRRLGNALRLAENLRSLDERRTARRAEHRARREAERARLTLARLRRRLRFAAGAVAAALVLLAVLFQARRIARQTEEAATARELVRVAVASDWLARDPTRAALVLLELEEPERVPEAAGKLWRVLGEELTQFERRHGDWVLDAAWSPSGERIATASSDGTVRVSRADGSGSPIVLAGHGAPVLKIAWSPDGDRLASSSQDGTARVWQLGGGAGTGGGAVEERVLTGHEDWVWSLAWSPDGTRLVTVSWDHTARLWRLGGDAVTVLEGHRERVVSAAWSPDGSRLATASWDGTARLWDAHGEPLGRDGVPRVLESPEALWTVSFSPDGRRLLTASWDGTARIWRLDDGGPTLVLRDQGGLWTASFSPDGARLLTASSAGQVRVWHADGRPVLDSALGIPLVFEHDAAVYSAAWSPDGRRVATASGDGTGRVFTLDGGGAVSERSFLRGHGGEVRRASWSPDGRRLITASRDGTARVWRPGEGVEPASETAPRADLGIFDAGASTSPDGRYVVVVGEGGAEALVWTADRRGDPVRLRHQAAVLAAAFTSAGQILTATADGALRRFNVDGGGEILVFGEPVVSSVSAEPPGRDEAAAEVSRGLVAAAFSADASRLATASAESLEVYLLDDTPDPPSIVLALPAAPLQAVAWSPDGQRLFALTQDREVLVWRLASEDLLVRLRGGTRMCLAADFRETHLGEGPKDARERSEECRRFRERRGASNSSEPDHPSPR